MSKRSSDEELVVVADSNGTAPSSPKKRRLDPDLPLPEFCLFITVQPECDEMLQLLRFRVASTSKASLIIEAIEEAQRIDEDSEDPWHTSEMFDHIYHMMDKRNIDVRSVHKVGKLVPPEIKALSREEFGEWEILGTESGLIAPAANTAIYHWCSSF